MNADTIFTFLIVLSGLVVSVYGLYLAVSAWNIKRMEE